MKKFLQCISSICRLKMFSYGLKKLRIKIARKAIAVASKQTTFTVSIGVAATTNKTDIQEILTHAELALKKAIEKGGNSVKSIS